MNRGPHVKLLSCASFVLLLGVGPSMDFALGEQQPGGQSGSVVSNNLIEFATFGVALEAPNGYRMEPPLDIGHIVRWVKDGGSHTLILVETVPADDDSLAAYVAGAKDKVVGVGASEQKTTLGGEEAVRLVAKQARSGAPREVIFAKHGKCIYMVDGYDETKTFPAEDLEKLRSSWKWIAPARPHQNLVLGSPRLSLLQGRLSMLAPAVMRPSPVDDQDHDKMVLYDYGRGLFPFIMDIQVIPNDSELSMVQLTRNFGTIMPERVGAKDKFTWSMQSGTAPCYLTQTFRANLPNVKDGFEYYCRIGFAKLGAKQVLLFSWTITGQDQDARRKYIQCIDEMMQSIQVKPLAKAKQ